MRLLQNACFWKNRNGIFKAYTRAFKRKRKKMKLQFKNMSFFFIGQLFAAVLFLCVNFDGCDKHDNFAVEPQFVSLQEGQGCYYACIYDDGSVSKVKDLSFYGQTGIGGVRRESDDSVNKLELSTVKQIMVKVPAFESLRFRDREYMLVAVEYSTGAVINDLLFPKHVIVCGVEEETGMKRAWFLHKLEKIVMDCKRAPRQEKSSVSQSRRHRSTETQALERDVMQATTQQQAQGSFHVVPAVEEEKLQDKTLIQAFLSVIDSIIDFFKAIVKTIF